MARCFAMRMILAAALFQGVAANKQQNDGDGQEACPDKNAAVVSQSDDMANFKNQESTVFMQVAARGKMNLSANCAQKNDGIPNDPPDCRCRGDTFCSASKPYCTDHGNAYCSRFPTCEGAHASQFQWAYGVYPQPMSLGGCQCGAHECTGTSDNTMCMPSGCVTKTLDCAYEDDGAPKSMSSFKSCCDGITGSNADRQLEAKCKLAKCRWENDACTHAGEFNLGGNRMYKSVRPDWLKTYFNEVPCDPLSGTTANCLRGVMSLTGTNPSHGNYWQKNRNDGTHRDLRWDIGPVNGMTPAAGIYASELMLKCGTDEARVEVMMGNYGQSIKFERVNSVKIYMNEVLTETYTGKDWTIWRGQLSTISNGRKFDHLRIEVDAQANANFKSVLTLQDATAFFDGCMEAKECLIHLSGPAGDHLRQDNDAQLTCLTTTPADTCENGDVCACWKDCLEEEGSLAITVAVLQAALLSPSAVGSSGSSASCSDSDNGATDPYGDACSDYSNYPSWCGGYDDNDFTSTQMCCACGGGSSASLLQAAPVAMIEVGRDSGCFTPNFGDPESYLCDCLEDLQAACGNCNGNGWLDPSCVECIKSQLCYSQRVCAAWKNGPACTGIAAPASFMQRASMNASQLGQKKIASVLTQDLEEKAASLAVAGREEKMDEALERKSNQC